VYGVVNEFGVEGAMRVTPPSSVRNPEAASRFLQEARLLARLKHPNIVRIIDFARLADGTPFVVMERLKGRTLDVARRALRASGGVTPSLSYEIIRQLCEGLHFAHSHDPPIVHRDVKPENVFVHVASASTVLIKLIDFGIAAVIDGKDLARALGTPRYMAPELLLGEPASPQSDIYSTALLLYEMLTDRFPWDSDIQTASAMANAHLRLEPAPPSRYAPFIPSAVDECLMQALAKDPKARPSSAHELSTSLCVLQFVNDRSTKTDIDVDSTPLTRERDLVDLAALAGATKDPFRTERDQAERKSPELTVTAVLRRKRRRRAVVTGTLSTCAVLLASVGAAVLARPTTVSSRATSGAVAQSVGVAADPALMRPAPVATPPTAAASTSRGRVPATVVPQGRSLPEEKPIEKLPAEKLVEKTDGGEQPPAFVPVENGEMPFLPEKP
jgi:serine/threonine protein kinase